MQICALNTYAQLDTHAGVVLGINNMFHNSNERKKKEILIMENKFQENEIG